MTDRLLYVYGLIRTVGAFEPDMDGLLREPVERIAFGDISVLVSAAGEDEIMSTRRNMLAHARILEAAMEAGPVLPFRFGMVAGEKRLKQVVIGEGEAALHEAFAALEGRTEMGIRVAFDRDAVMKRIVAENADLKRAHDSLKSRDPKSTHYQRLELGRAVHGHLGAQVEAAAAALSALVNEHCDQVVSHQPGDDIEILHVAALATEDQSAALLEALEAFDAAEPDLYQIKIVAPVPPYNFVSLQLGGDESMAA